MPLYRCRLLCLALLLCLQLVNAGPFNALRRQDEPINDAPTSTAGAITFSRPSVTVAPSGGSSKQSNSPSTTVDSSIRPSGTASTVVQVPVTTVSNEAEPTSSTNVDLLPIQPKLTPAMGLSGVLLLLTGLAYGIVGIKNKWIYVFGSAAYLTALAVTVLIVFLMSPPVSNAIQGAFFVAAFFTGLIFGVLSLVFSDITEGFGCLLGGFCLSMWLLSLKNGGMISSGTGRAIFIGCMAAGGYSLSFSHYTRTYGLIASIAFSGATATILGIDCLAGAGWKEFWLYLWNLNDNIFPLNTTTYPVTKNIKAELAGVVIIAVFGVVSQMRVWKLVKEHRANSAAQQLERQQDQDREEEALGRKIEDNFHKERAQWEAAYGGKSAQDMSIRSSITSPKRSTSIRDKGNYTIDNMELTSMSKSVFRPPEPDTSAGATVTVGVLEDDHIQQIDATGNPIISQGMESKIEPGRGETMSVKPRTMGSRVPNSLVTKRTSLRPSAPPPPPPVVPLPFIIPAGGDSKTEEHDNASISAAPKTEHDSYRRPMSKRISDMSILRQRMSLDLAESQEALIKVPYGDDDRASSVAATLDHDHDDLSLRQVSPPGSPIDTDHRTTPGVAGLTQGDSDPKCEQPRKRRESRIRADTVVFDNKESSEGQQTKSAGSVTLSEDPPGEHATSQVGSLRDSVLADRVSKVALSYRTNEWAKHLESAEKPDLDDLAAHPSPGVILEEGSTETPIAARNEAASLPSRAHRNSKRTSVESKFHGASNFGLDLSTSVFSQESLIDQRSLTHSPPIDTPEVLSRPNSNTGLDALSPLPSNTLMSRRENLIKNRISSQSLTPHGSSANLLAEQNDQENMTLAQRRQLLQYQTSPPQLQHQSSISSQRKTPPSASQKWQKKSWGAKGAPPGFDSHQPKRTSSSQSDQKREQLYAGWRGKMRDVTPPQTAEYIAEQQRVALMKERRKKEAEKQQREVVQQQRASMMDSMMRSGQMLDAHREAMRKMQANASRAPRPLALITTAAAITTAGLLTTAPPRPSSTAFAPPATSPPPARWSLTNRIFSLNLRGLYQGPPRLPASRLWNPVNSSPRTLAVQHPPAATPPDHLPNLPIEGAHPGARDEYPLLTLPQRRLSRQSPASSLAIERSTAEDSVSGRTSIALPRHRRSLPPTSPTTPAPTIPGPAAMSPARARDKDIEAGTVPTKPELSRVSLPGSRRTSMGSRSASAPADDDDDDDAVSEFPWGPSHPCFPHPNPHVPLDSPLYATTRIIRIKRDWMLQGDLAPAFANLYPEILDPLVTEDDFRILIKKVNDTLSGAFDPFTFRAWLDAVMGVATFWLWDDAGLTGIKRQLADLERWIQHWNQDVGAKEGVKVIPLRRTGYLTLDLQIPDPHLGSDTGSLPNTQQDQLSTNPVQDQAPYLPYPLTPTLQVNSQPPVIEALS